MKIPRLSILLVAFPVTLFSSAVDAGDWKTSYGVSAREQFTDNVCLEDGGDESEWITTLTPSFGISGKGGRTKLDVTAAFEANNLDDDSRCEGGNNSNRGSDVDNFNPRVNAKGMVELISDKAFIDLQAQVRQNRTNSFSGGGDSSLNRRGNTNTTYDYSVSPYVNGKIKDAAFVSLRYTYDEQKNSEDELDDSEQQLVNLSVSSVPGQSPLGWALVGSYQTVDYDENSNSGRNREDELSSAVVRLSYQFSRKWQIFGSAGEDFNDFESTNTDIDGSRWSAGVNWTPNPRTEVQLGTGNRFIGTTPTLNVSHRRKRSLFTASYQKSVTFTRSLRSEEIDIPLFDDNGDPLLDFEGLPIVLSFSATTETRSPVVDERAQLGYRWSGARTSFGINLLESTQDREEDGLSSTFRTVSIRGQRTLSPKTVLTARVIYHETEVDEDSTALGDDSEEYRFSLGARRKLGTKTSMTFNYTHNDRRSDVSDDEYRENRLSLGVVMNW